MAKKERKWNEDNFRLACALEKQTRTLLSKRYGVTIIYQDGGLWEFERLLPIQIYRSRRGSLEEGRIAGPYDWDDTRKKKPRRLTGVELVTISDGRRYFHLIQADKTDDSFIGIWRER